jgi:NAD(P)-dependent dehydrogenase (short-subunit alcohol dehydrogenase family)
MQRPNFSLDGKVAVITGASRGIGSAVAAAAS